MDTRQSGACHPGLRLDHGFNFPLVSAAILSGSLRTFVGALKSADLVNTLEGREPFTVFAPTDAAFASLSDGQLASLMSDRGRLVEVITHHLVPGTLLASELLKRGSTAATTVKGDTLRIVARGGKVLVSGAEVLEADIRGSNGVIHVIDRVLVPEG